MNQPASTLTFRRSSRHYFVTVFGLIFAFAGIGKLYGTISTASRDRFAAAHWEQAESTITKCTVNAVRNGGPHGMGSPPGEVGIVEFSYSVNGQLFVSNGMDFRSYWGDSGILLLDSAAIAGRYYVGQHVPCFYDPEHAERAVLSRDVSNRMFFSSCLLGALFSICGAALASYAWSGFGDKPARNLSAVGVDELQITSMHLGTRFRFPRRKSDRWFTSIAPGCFGVPFVAIGIGAPIFLLFSDRLGIRSTSSGGLGGELEGRIIASLVFGPPFLLGGLFIIAHSLLAAFGNSEIIIGGGRLRARERAGPLWFGASTSIDKIMELVVLTGPEGRATKRVANLARPHEVGASAFRKKGLAVIEARGPGLSGLAIAQGYPAHVLRIWADGIAETIHRGCNSRIATAAPIVHQYDSKDAPPISPEYLRPDQTRVIEERIGTILRLTIPGQGTLRFAVFPVGILLLPLVLMCEAPSLTRNIKFDALAIGLPLLIVFVACYFIWQYASTKIVMDADHSPDGALTVTTYRGAGPKVQSLARRDLQEICVGMQQGVKGGTIYRLDVISRTGRRWIVRGWSMSLAELDWVVALLQLHMMPSVPPADRAAVEQTDSAA